MRGYPYDQPDRPSPAELALDDPPEAEWPEWNAEEAFTRYEEADAGHYYCGCLPIFGHGPNCPIH